MSTQALAAQEAAAQAAAHTSVAFHHHEYSVVGIAAFLILSLWVGLHYYAEIELQQSLQAAKNSLFNYARAFGEHTERTARVLDQTAMFVKREYETKGARLDLRKYSEDGVFLDQFYKLIVVVGEDGWVKLFNRPLPPSNVSDLEHFRVLWRKTPTSCSSRSRYSADRAANGRSSLPVASASRTAALAAW